MQAQAPELLVSTVVLMGEAEGATGQGHAFNEYLEIEQAGRRIEDGRQEDGELGHYLLAVVEEVPMVTQKKTKTQFLQSTQSSSTGIP